MQLKHQFDFKCLETPKDSFPLPLFPKSFSFEEKEKGELGMGKWWWFAQFLHVLYYISCMHEDFDSELFIKVLMPVYGFSHVRPVLWLTWLGFCLGVCALSFTSRSQPARPSPGEGGLPLYFWVFFLLFETAILVCEAISKCFCQVFWTHNRNQKIWWGDIRLHDFEFAEESPACMGQCLLQAWSSHLCL